MKSITYKMTLDIIGDDRGSLIAVEQNESIPFDLRRVYYMFGNGMNIRRGFHAHRKTKQVLICVNGSCDVLTEDSRNVINTRLDTPSKGLYIEGLVWHEMYNFSENAVLLVLADSHYDESDYVRNYQEFHTLLKKHCEQK